MADSNRSEPTPLAHSPNDAAKRLGYGGNVRAVYTLIAKGELKTYKVGKRRFITDDECKRLVDRHMAEGAK